MLTDLESAALIILALTFPQVMIMIYVLWDEYIEHNEAMKYYRKKKGK